ADGFTDRTLRVIAHPSVTGGQARIRLSNTGASAPVTIDAATIAGQSTGAATSAPPVALKFGSGSGVTIPAGGEVYSVPVAFSAGAGNLAVSIHIANATGSVPVHTVNGAVTYVAAGNNTLSQVATPFTTTLTSTYYLSGIDVIGGDGGTTAILADQNTSATGPTWGDTLAGRLVAALPYRLVTVPQTPPPPPG